MSYNNRLIIKREFELDGNHLVNKLKMVEYVDFVQLFITNGKIKETGQAVQQLKEYLKMLK